MDVREKKNLESNLNKICLMLFIDRMWFAQPVFVIFLLAQGMSLTQIGWIVGGSWEDRISQPFYSIFLPVSGRTNIRASLS